MSPCAIDVKKPARGGLGGGMECYCFFGQSEYGPTMANGQLLPSHCHDTTMLSRTSRIRVQLNDAYPPPVVVAVT